MPAAKKTDEQTEQTADKAAKFAKLASTRTQKALDALDVLGNCFNRNNYSYTDEQVEKIFTALEAKIDTIRSLTVPGVKPSENTFTL